MYRWQKNSVCILVVTGILYVLSFPMNSWLSSTMPRHQLLQLPGMVILGILLALSFPKIRIRDISNGTSALIFVMASLIFWMLPRSVDLASINPSINRIMNLNMIIAGFLAYIVLRDINFKIKIVFLEMLSAMLLAVGITLHSFDTLLCSSFNIEQQKTTGYYLMMAGFIFFVATLIIFFVGLGKMQEDQNRIYEN